MHHRRCTGGFAALLPRVLGRAEARAEARLEVVS